MEMLQKDKPALALFPEAMSIIFYWIFKYTYDAEQKKTTKPLIFHINSYSHFAPM